MGWPPVGIEVVVVASSRTREPPATAAETASCGAVSTGDSVPASDSEDVGPLNMNVKLVDASAEGRRTLLEQCTTRALEDVFLFNELLITY